MYQGVAGDKKTSSKMHERAGQIQDGPPIDPERHAVMEEVSGLLDTSDTVWQQLYGGKFEENEHGYVTFNIYGMRASENQLNHDGSIIKIEVCFTDSNGIKTTLGGIKRITGSLDLGVAFSYISSSKTLTERLIPEDEKNWDIIVGTIERAVATCKLAEVRQKKLTKNWERRRLRKTLRN